MKAETWKKNSVVGVVSGAVKVWEEVMAYARSVLDEVVRY